MEGQANTIERIWALLTTITEASENAALEKCAELGFDINRGTVSLNESFINLNSARDILSDAIKNKKLIQLPITIQNTLFAYLEKISNSLTNLLNGVDEIVNLAENIENLNVAIWQFGFHNLSDQVLGYLDKMNQLKSQEVEIAKLKRDLEEALIQKSALEDLIGNATKTVENLNGIVSQSTEEAKKATENVDITSKASQSATAFLATIQQNDTTATQLLATTKTSSAEVAALEPKIKEFYSQIDQYKGTMAATAENSQNIINSNNSATNELISKLRELEEQIKDQIQKATGYSLFHSFQKRQTDLASSKNIWFIALVGFVLTSLAATVYVVHTTQEYNAAFYIKLSLALPLVYAITFCSVQYGRERKLEEEYAFKSNISISLIPYKELVEKFIDNGQVGEREKFTNFLIDAIAKVYTSPIDKTFEVEHKPKINTNDALKQLEKTIETLVKPLEPLLKILKH